MRVRWYLALAALALGIVAAAWPLAAARAHFVPDDDRYLNAIRVAEAGDATALIEATVVENRWDQHWWIPDGTYIRFFRPFVIASYVVDEAVWGMNAAGFTLTNVALHLACTWLVYVVMLSLLERWRGPQPLAALAGALLFAVQAAHAEQLWYIAGRTDTLAALAFLGGLVAWTRRRGPLVLGALFFVMLLAKEYTVLFVPVVVLLERWLPAGAWRGWRALFVERRATWAALGVALVVFLALRAIALGEAGAGVKPYPYFFLPEREHFVARTGAIALEYATSLVLGRPIATFIAGLDEVVARHGWWRLAGSGAALLAFAAYAVRTPPGRFGLASFALLLVPLLPLYSTGRYLYLPTIGLVLAFAAVLVQLRSRRVAVALAVLAIGSQAWWSQDALQTLPKRPGTPTSGEQVLALFESAPFDLAPGAPPIFVAEFPMPWLAQQFVRDSLELRLGHAVPPIQLLSTAPRGPGPGLLDIERRGTGFAFARPNGPLYLADPRSDFEQRRVTEGEVIYERGYEFEVLRELDGLATAAEVRPATSDFQLGVFRPTTTSPGWRAEAVR
ncbi:MAG: hypothetical protein WD226_05100 [Planctomycetota bacterium]